MNRQPNLFGTDAPTAEGSVHASAERPPDRLYQCGAYADALFAADPADGCAGHGCARRAVWRRLWADPGARHGHVRVLRGVLSAAGLDCATHRPPGADDAVFL